MRASSIIYAQVGSDNGGIVVNLGTGGVSFQAAQPLNEEINATLRLKLRGSGLNLELPGELAWLGPTQKEAGIRFAGISPEAQQEIASWVARETGKPEPAPPRPVPAPMPAMPGLVVRGEKSAAGSLSAAMAMAQAGSAGSFRAVPKEEPKPPLAAPVHPAIAMPSIPAVPKHESAIEGFAVSESHVAAPQSAADVPDSGVGASAARKQALLAKFLDEQRMVALLGSSTNAATPVTLQPRTAPLVAAQASPVDNTGPQVPPATPNQRIPLARASASVGPVLLPAPAPSKGLALENWIRTEVFAAWRWASPGRKLLIAGSGAAIVLALVLILSSSHLRSRASSQLAVTAVSAQHQPDERPTASDENGPAPSAAPVTTQTVSSPTPRPTVTSAPVPIAPTPPVADAPAPAYEPAGAQQPLPSLFEKLRSALLGSDPDQSAEINDSQVHVQVWSSRKSGYYYCTDSDFYKNVRPGVFIEQGEALQRGYRPRLGRFCN